MMCAGLVSQLDISHRVKLAQRRASPKRKQILLLSSLCISNRDSGEAGTIGLEIEASYMVLLTLLKSDWLVIKNLGRTSNLKQSNSTLLQIQNLLISSSLVPLF